MVLTEATMEVEEIMGVTMGVDRVEVIMRIRTRPWGEGEEEEVVVVMVEEMEVREMEREKEEMIMRVAFLVEVDPQLDRGWLIFIETGRRSAPRWGQSL